MKKININKNLLKIVAIFVVFFGSISLGQLVRIKIENFILYPHDFLAAFVFVRWGISAFRLKDTLLNQLKLSYGWLVLLIWILLGWSLALLKHDLGYSAILTALRLCVYAIAVHKIFQTGLKHFQAWHLRAMVFFTTFLMVTWGILQYVFMPDTRFLHIFGWDDHYYRLIGPLLDPNFAGLIALIALLNWQTLFTIKPFHQHFKKFTSAFNLIVVSTCLIALTMTFSRSSWLALAASIIISLIFTSRKIFKKQVLQYVSWLTLLIICFLLLPKPTGEGIDITRTASVTARTSLVHSLTQSWSWQDYLFGRGLFNVRPNIDSLGVAEIEKIPNTSRQPDNLIIQLVGSIGIGGVGLVSFLIWKNRRLFEIDHRFLPLLAAWIIHAQFNNSIFQPQLWLLLIALLFCFKGESNQENPNSDTAQ